MLNPLNWLKGQRKELCPFCFEYFYLGATPFRCANSGKYCTPVMDPILAKQWEDRRPVGKVIPPLDGQFVRSMRCQDCGYDSNKRICPKCHADLPHTIGQHKNYIFAIIGAKEAGKSHYIAVLIDQLKRHVGRSVNMLIEPMGDVTINRYATEFRNPVFTDGKVIEATRSALADRKVQQPLVYSITITTPWLKWLLDQPGLLRRVGNTKILGRLGRNTSILVFFDTAGEDLNAEDVMSAVNKYIYRSKGIILLIDPLQLTQVRSQLSGTALPNINTENSDIMTRVTKLIHKGLNYKSMSDIIHIPIAIAFSKFDAVRPILSDQLQLNATAQHDGGFDAADFAAINAEMMALLENWGGQSLVQQVHTRYANYGFFGLSALGCNPHGTNKIPRVSPRRVEDPFLWLLATNKLIRNIKT